MKKNIVQNIILSEEYTLDDIKIKNTEFLYKEILKILEEMEKEDN